MVVLSTDTTIAILADMHSGGTTALFPNKFWQFKHKNHTPTKQDMEMFGHFKKCAELIGARRKGKRLIVVHDGDAIEGWHHNSQQIHTANKDEQAEIHVELMDYFLNKIKFGKGDKLYYINGTETHTGEKEDKIAEYLKAQKNPEGGRVFDHLSLNINGRTIWFAHHGKGRGTGANEGNGLIILLRNIYFDNLKLGLASPDMIITGHTHTPAYSVFTVRERENFRMMHAIIAPSWQRKTRYGYKAAPVEVNEIGAVTFDISRSGEISQPKFILMQTGVTAVNSDAI